jgi:hypothetical protein
MAKRKIPKPTPDEIAREEWWDRRGRERIAERLEIEGEHEQARIERELIRRRWGPSADDAGDPARA